MTLTQNQVSEDPLEQGLRNLAGLLRVMASQLSEDELVTLIEGLEGLIQRFYRYAGILRVAQAYLEKELINRRLRG